MVVLPQAVNGIVHTYRILGDFTTIVRLVNLQKSTPWHSRSTVQMIILSCKNGVQSLHVSSHIENITIIWLTASS